VKRYDISYLSVNTKDCPKRITATVFEPERVGANTGAMLFTHGWGNSRRRGVKEMEHACELYDVVCISVEYRQSGFDHDMERGTGWDCPYDFSFYQVFDVMNGLRMVLSLKEGLNTRRLFHYGGSQGGHIALLSAVLAPKTFAAVYSSCGITHVQPSFLEWAGRELLPHEVAYRDVSGHAEGLLCPVFLDHGTNDVEVPHAHTEKLEKRLRELGKRVEAVYYEGGGHQLEPVSSRLEAFEKTAPRFLPGMVNGGEAEVVKGGLVELDCGERRLVVDWGKGGADVGMVRWEKG
jgi:acetyl esterase/lipase